VTTNANIGIEQDFSNSLSRMN